MADKITHRHQKNKKKQILNYIVYHKANVNIFTNAPQISQVL